MGISLSSGNSKLVKTSGDGTYKILSFGLPADVDVDGFNTCPGANACKAVCYAKQGRYLMPNVMQARMANLDATRSDTFVSDMIAAISKRRSYNTIRIHDSGDIYSQEYYNKWCDIARALPNHIFYAYTKSMHLDLYTNKPENLRIIQSLGGRYDNLVDLTRPHSRIFSSHEAAERAGYEDGSISDTPAIEGTTRISLVYHGTRKLTIAQQNFFS